MKLVVKNTKHLEGKVKVPPSKSHTHRAIILACLASGTSIIKNPLLSEDCLSTIEACRAIGANIGIGNNLKIKGVNGKPQTPKEIIDVKNSGTTIRFMTSVVALCNGSVTNDYLCYGCFINTGHISMTKITNLYSFSYPITYFFY